MRSGRIGTASEARTGEYLAPHSWQIACASATQPARRAALHLIKKREALMTPLFIMFYRLRALGPAWPLLAIAALGTWAIVVNGTFFAAMSIRTRSREIMLPLLLFPISIPALLAMVQATTAILSGEGARFWIAMLVTYDLVFTTACLLLFETVLNAE